MSDIQAATPRRVLGALAVNTPTTASKLRNPLSASHKPISLPPVGRVSTPPRVGQKRSIDQVEGTSPKSTARRGSPPQVEARENPIRVYEDVQTPEQTEFEVSISNRHQCNANDSIGVLSHSCEHALWSDTNTPP